MCIGICDRFLKQIPKYTHRYTTSTAQPYAYADSYSRKLMRNVRNRQDYCHCSKCCVFMKPNLVFHNNRITCPCCSSYVRYMVKYKKSPEHFKMVI